MGPRLPLVDRLDAALFGDVRRTDVAEIGVRHGARPDDRARDKIARGGVLDRLDDVYDLADLRPAFYRDREAEVLDVIGEIFEQRHGQISSISASQSALV